MKVEDHTGRFEKLATLVNNSKEEFISDKLVLCINQDDENKKSLLLHLDGRDEKMSTKGRQLRVPVGYLTSLSYVKDVLFFVDDHMLKRFIKHSSEVLKNEGSINPVVVDYSIQEMWEGAQGRVSSPLSNSSIDTALPPTSDIHTTSDDYYKRSHKENKSSLTSSISTIDPM